MKLIQKIRKIISDQVIINNKFLEMSGDKSSLKISFYVHLIHITYPTVVLNLFIVKITYSKDFKLFRNFLVKQVRFLFQFSYMKIIFENVVFKTKFNYFERNYLIYTHLW